MPPADVLDAMDEDAFELRQGGHPTERVARGAEVANLGERDESLVARVVAADTVEEVDVHARREPSDLEIEEPPEVEPPADHRVHATHQGVFPETRVRASEREAVDGRVGSVGAGRRDRDNDVAYLVRPLGCAEMRAELFRNRVFIGRPRALGEVELDDDDRRRRDLARERDDGVDGLWQIGEVSGGRDDVEPLPVADELSSGKLAISDGDRLELLQRFDLVVAPGQDLEHWLVIDTTGPAFGEELDERLGTRDQCFDARRVLRTIRVRLEVREVLPHLEVYRVTAAFEMRCVEHREPQGTREITDDRIPELRGDDEAIQRLVELLEECFRERVGLLQPAIEQREHRRDLMVRPLQRLKHPVHGLLELGRAIEAVDAEMREHATQPRLEPFREALRVHVERSQVREQELARRSGAFVGVFVAAVARNRAKIRERAQDPKLRVQNLGVVFGDELTGSRVRRNEVGRVRVDVEAQHETAERVDDRQAPRARFGRRGRCVGIEADTHGAARRIVGGGDRLHCQQRRSGVDLHVRGDEHLIHPPGERRDDDRFHLHRLDHRNGRSGLDDVARLDIDRDDDTGRDRGTVPPSSREIRYATPSTSTRC